MSDSAAQFRAFIEKHRIAKTSNSKEIRLTMQDCDALASAIALTMAEHIQLLQRITDLQDQILSAEIKQDGGKF